MVDRWTRWETEAIRGRRGRPRPGARRASSPPPRQPGEVIDLRDDAAATPPPNPRPQGQAGEGVLVPIDAWNRMLNQLGNLHEAGRDLAEARERAAKAETQVEFLRERLAELRATEPEDEAGTESEPQRSIGTAMRDVAAGAVRERWRRLSGRRR